MANEQKTMKRKALTLLIVLLSTIVLTACSSSSDPETEALASCLEEKGVKFYGAFWCSHCNDQKELFGKTAWQKVYIECSLPGGQGQTEVCTEAGITGYPTWVLADGSKVEGTQSLEKLKELSGC